MMRSLYSGVSGLRNHQTRMDVIGNNIANVNTVGYKASRVIFQDIYSQTVKTASGPQTVPTPIGGTNPMQIGLGMNVQAIDILFNSAAAQFTGAPFDLMIQGDGFFVLNTGYTAGAAGTPGINYYTRAGNFYVDKNNNILAANGYSVMGWMNQNVGLDNGDPDDPIPLPEDYGAGPYAPGDMEPLHIPMIGTPPNQTSEYENISINDKGEIIGTRKADGVLFVIGKVAISTFENNQGLEKCGQNMYRRTNNSGNPQYNVPGANGAGLLNPGSLEMSNVDLAGEFTDMIVTQRGFQANSRIITVSDTMLEELINLKR